MPFTKGQSDNLSPLRDLAYGWGEIVPRRAQAQNLLIVALVRNGTVIP